jgi:hypothetical protein
MFVRIFIRKLRLLYGYLDCLTMLFQLHGWYDVEPDGNIVSIEVTANWMLHRVDW